MLTILLYTDSSFIEAENELNVSKLWFGEKFDKIHL